MQTADPDSAVSEHHSGPGLDDSDSDGPHKSIRKEAIARLRVTCQRMVANPTISCHECALSRRGTVLMSRLTKLTGVIVTGSLSLVITDVNSRHQYQLKCEDGVIDQSW